MNTAQLETFAELARTLSYTQTARNVHLSQPAVSQQVARLEEELGARLLDRDSRGVRLTAAGKAFAEDCADILSRIGAARTRARELGRRAGMRVRVGFSGHAFLWHMGRLMARMATRIPRADLSLVQDTPDILIAEMARGSLDALFCSRVSGTIPAGTDFVRLLDTRYVCVTAADSPIAALDEVSSRELDGIHIVCLEEGRAPDDMRSIQARLLLETPHSPVSYTRSEITGATMAQAGVGIAVMPDTVCPDLPGIVRVPLANQAPMPFGAYMSLRTDEKTRAALLAEASSLFSQYPATSTC